MARDLHLPDPPKVKLDGDHTSVEHRIWIKQAHHAALKLVSDMDLIRMRIQRLTDQTARLRKRPTTTPGCGYCGVGSRNAYQVTFTARLQRLYECLHQFLDPAAIIIRNLHESFMHLEYNKTATQPPSLRKMTQLTHVLEAASKVIQLKNDTKDDPPLERVSYIPSKHRPTPSPGLDNDASKRHPRRKGKKETSPRASHAARPQRATAQVIDNRTRDGRIIIITDKDLGKLDPIGYRPRTNRVITIQPTTNHA